MSGLNEIQNLLIPLAKRQSLTLEESKRAFQIIMNGGATPAQMGAFLMGLRQKGETVDEITGGAIVLREKCTPIKTPFDVIDTCGTGGDAKGTLNISTAAALVAASAGAKVAKHGNRSITSASGSADVLAALGVKITAEKELVEKSLAQCGICFIMAPRYHEAMRHIAPVRRELGLRSIFNLLGPLINPARPKRQLLGVYAEEWLLPMAETLKNLGSEHAWVVHGTDGTDELTLSGVSHVVELKDRRLRRFSVTPEEAGLSPAPLSALKGGTPEENAEKLMRLLCGEEGPYLDAVALNAGAALVIAGMCNNLHQGVQLAKEAVNRGKAKETLAQLTYFMNMKNDAERA